jgi:hypothetical protein
MRSRSAIWTKSNANLYGFGLPNPDSRIFLCGPQICIGSVPCVTDPLLRIHSGCKQSSCVNGNYFKASGGSQIPCPEFSWITVFLPWVQPPNTTTIFLVFSHEHIQTGWSCQFRLAHALGGVTRMPWMPDWPMNVIRLRFIRYVRFL